MTYFAEYFSKYLNTTQNPTYKFNTMAESIQYLYSSLQNGQTLLPTENLDFKERLYNVPLKNQKIFTSLSKKEIVNGIACKVGFSPVKIITCCDISDIIKLLSDLPPEQDQIYIQIFQTYNLLGPNLQYFQALQHLYTELKSSYLISIDYFTDSSECFGYMINQDSFPTTLNFSEVAVYPFYHMLNVVSKLSIFGSSYYSTMNNILPTIDSINKESLAIQFESYISDNLNEITDDIIKFSLVNIFQMGGNISSHLTEYTLSSLRVSILKLKDIILTYHSTSNSLDINTQILFDYFNHNSYIYAGDLLHNGLYSKLGEYYADNQTGWYIQQEELIISNLISYLTEQSPKLTTLEQISFQFSQTPLFFINSYVLSHKWYSKELVHEFGNGFNIDEYMSKMSITNPQFIKQWIIDHPITHNEDLLKLTAFIYYQKMLLEFFNDKAVTAWIIDDILPILNFAVNDNYLMKTDIFKHVDHIRSYLILIIMKDILNGKLFNVHIDDLNQQFNLYVGDNKFEVTDDELLQVSSNHVNGAVSEIVLDNIFKSTMITKYLEGILTAYSL